MAELTQEELGIIDRFKAQAREFWSLWKSLNNQQAYVSRQAPAVQREYKTLIEKGSSIRSGVETVTGIIDKAGAMIDSAKNWFLDTFGLDGVPYEYQQLGNLGIVPLIPIAVVAGSLAAMGKWVSDVYLFNQRLAEIKRLEAKGVPPAQAASIVEKSMPSGMFGNMNKLAVPLLLLGAAVLLLPQFKKKGRR